MRSLILIVLKSKYFIRPAMALTITIAGIILYYSSISDKTIFPDAANYNYETYTDEVSGGNSRILNFSVGDSTMKMSFRLNEAYTSPYVGVSVTPLKSKFIDAGPYNQISIKIKGENIERVGISIFNPLRISESLQNEEALYHFYLNITTKVKYYHLPIKHFTHPDWWKDLHQISADVKTSVDMRKILNVNIGSAYTPSKTDIKTIEIYSLAFTRNNHALFILLGLCWFLALAILFLANYIVLKRKNRPDRVTVFYQALEIEDRQSPIEKCFDYINRHFSNNELSLELVSNETALPQRQITNAIHTEYNCNFKTYINRIRMNESKRLLETTDLNIGEIAFKVGFNNQSHFNRVFKTEMQMSPGEYREKLRR